MSAAPAQGMESAIYVGRVRHRRHAPRPHAFTYRLFMMYLDLDELPAVFAGRWLWRYQRPGLAAFHRADYLGDPQVPLSEAVRGLVAARTGLRPRGPVRMLTHLRYAGWAFNPVTFYYCWDGGETAPAAIVAEITNTPWGERHAYVLPASAGCGAGSTLRFRFAKRFHVSPFMPMDQDYEWHFTPPGRRLAVHMRNRRAGRCVFDATLALERRPISTATLTRALIRFPLMSAQVSAAIYWQALRLWWKRAPFHPHPSCTRQDEEDRRDGGTGPEGEVSAAFDRPEAPAARAQDVFTAVRRGDGTGSWTR